MLKIDILSHAHLLSSLNHFTNITSSDRGMDYQAEATPTIQQLLEEDMDDSEIDVIDDLGEAIHRATIMSESELALAKHLLDEDVDANINNCNDNQQPGASSSNNAIDTASATTQCKLQLSDHACPDPRCADPKHHSAPHKDTGAANKVIDVTNGITTEGTEVEIKDIFTANTVQIVASMPAIHTAEQPAVVAESTSKRDLSASSSVDSEVYYIAPGEEPKEQREKRRKVTASRSLTKVALMNATLTANSSSAPPTTGTQTAKTKAPGNSSKSSSAQGTVNATPTPTIPSLSQINIRTVFNEPKPVETPPADGQKEKNKRITLILPANLENYKVNEAALETWRLAKTYRANQQRAYLRADVIQQLMEHDCVPSCYLGANTLPRYLIPLTDSMAETIRRHGNEKARMAIEYLQTQCTTLRRRADNTLALLKTIYEEEGDRSFDKASELIRLMTHHYRGIEVKRLQTYFKKELERKPNNIQELGELIARDMPTSSNQTAATPPRRNDSRSPAPKRRRANQREPQTEQQRTPSQPRQNNSPRGNQTRGSQRGRGQPRNQRRRMELNPDHLRFLDFFQTRRARGRGRGGRGRGRNDNARNAYAQFATQMARAFRDMADEE